jgi:hypothetical protein
MCVCGLSKRMQQKNVRFSDCGKFLFWKNLQLLEDCKKTHPRSFSSDAVEATFSHVRLKGVSNDMTDSRTAEYAWRQILRCGIVKASKSSNIAQNTDYTSVNTIVPSCSKTNVNRGDLILPI